MSEDYKRPDPDDLLRRVKAEEKQLTRGKLKIFLGYVAGVGKTYAMLEAAHQRMDEGIDVVIGYAETHGRKETEELLSDLEIIPRQKINYRNTTLSDMDLDAVLRRHPQLVIVDELAHTNAPGLRHPKRYQDVEEILSAGIDVYSTINIQHLESLNDVIQQITGVAVHETVPDSFIDEAHEIELIDLPTDELLKRLRDGKVYLSEQAMRALEQFFRKGNLTALRELSLRRAAEQVDSQMIDYMHKKAIQGPWPASDRILVCISSHPMGERLIRTGRRLADDLRSEWYVIYVETPGHTNMPDENRIRVQANLQLAEEMGAKVFSMTADSVADFVIDFAHEHNVTKIVAGKPLRPRWFEFLRGGSVIDQIIRNSGKIDVYVVSEREGKFEKGLAKGWIPHRPLRRYAASITLVLLMTILGFPLRIFLDPTNLVMLYLVAVVISAVFLGRGPAILASFFSVLAFDFFFVDPRLSFSVADTQYLLTFIGLLLVGLIISNSAALLRDQVDVLRRREQQTQALNHLSRELTGAVSLDDVIEITLRNTREIFTRETVILLSQEDRLIQQAATPGFQLSESEKAVADWSYKNGQPAGRGTSTLPAAAIRYIPLKTARGIVGVLGVKSSDINSFLSIEQREMLEGVANLSALAIERASFAEKAAQSEMLSKTEKLQTALLNSISHEFRTPLASITGVLTSLIESERAKSVEGKLDSNTKTDLIASATQQAHRLNRLVENLLDMTRIEAGAIRLNKEQCDIQEIISSVLSQSPDRFCDHPIKMDIPDGLPLVNLDAVLIGQVLLNMLDNACKYSAVGQPIVIIVRQLPTEVQVEVQDHGTGIPPEDLEKIFNKFYRIQRDASQTGTGLGLSICKGIIEAHGGKIHAENNSNPGASVIFSLPLD
jgi:two-component system, OmpR family, sensor histidine kinase KdpD